MESFLLSAACVSMAAAAAAMFFLRDEKTSRVFGNVFWGVSFALVFICVAVMLANLVSLNCEYAYVYNHTDASLPIVYRVSALWAGQEGSLLTWLFFLGAAGFFVLNSKNAGKSGALFAAVALAVALLCCFSRPFEKLAEAPLAGAGLNAALQDPWMVVHPPLVFISYSLMAGLFSFLALPEKAAAKRKGEIVCWMRAGFAFLSAGIFTGCIWAYRALGWGGYWAWDPVENMALVPWFVLLAFLHDKGKINRFRLILPFALAAAGTFLVRSGILADASVHAYAQGNFTVTVLMTAFMIALLVLFFLRPFRSRPRPPDESVFSVLKDPRRLFKWATYVLALIVFGATLSPIATGYTLPGGFYDILLAFYGVCAVVLLILRQFAWFVEKILVVLPVATLLTALFIVFSRSDRYLWLLVLFVLLMAFVFCISGLFDRRVRYCSLAHAGPMLLMLGILLSSAFQAGGYTMVPADGGAAHIAGQSIAFAELMNGRTLIISAWPYDILLDTAKIAANGSDLIIPYTLKSGMPLLWIGGALTCIPAAPLIKALAAERRKGDMPAER
jgi:cytochrome c-type biogenesis protein CcmF